MALCSSMHDDRMAIVTVDLDKCNGAGICVDLCPVAVFELRGLPSYEGKKSVVVNNDARIACRACEARCATQGITITD
jgi:NAD-dependent dihydropyrimidine dehydrogenase PreA subunit